MSKGKVKKKKKQKEIKKSKNLPDIILSETANKKISELLVTLKPKERTIVLELLKGKDEKEALLIAGYAASTIQNKHREIIAKSGIKTAMQIILEDVGVTKARLAQKISDGLDAKKLHNIGLGDYVEVDDNAIQHKYTETALGLHGLGGKEIDITHHKSHEDQLRELQGSDIPDAEYSEILPEPVDSDV